MTTKTQSRLQSFMKLKSIAIMTLIASYGNAYCVLAPNAEASAQLEKTAQLQEKAISSCRAGNYDRAILYYRQWLDIDRKNPLIMKDLMWALWKQQRFSEAAAMARRILAVRPGNRDATNVLAELPKVEHRTFLQSLYQKAGRLESEGKTEDAVTLYRQLHTMQPDNTPFANHLLSGLRRLRLYEEGVRLARYMTEKNPDSYESWNWLASMESCSGHNDSAIRAYRKSLRIKPDQPDVHLLIGKEMVLNRDFENAIKELKPLLNETVDPQIYPLLANAEFWSMRYAESLPYWEKAIRCYPEKLNYRFYEAQALYFTGQQTVAIEKLNALYQKGYDKALDFIMDSMTARGDLAGARKMLEESLITITPKDEGRVLKLATIYEQNLQLKELSALLDRFLEICPGNLLALKLKAFMLGRQKKYRDELLVCRKMSVLNPGSIPAAAGTVDCQVHLGRYADALAASEKLRSLDPTNPFYLRNQTQLLYAVGDFRQARQLLLKWLKENKKHQVLPILLYHGLTPYADDPMLAYGYHHSLATFENHIKALRDAGYTPVVASQVHEWYINNVPLPGKPVMIAFDDGRSDSFILGDRILAKYGFRATMFAAVVNIEQRPPGYASWDKMCFYRSTGRWEIESHGDNAHITIANSPGGGKGLFLITRQWLEKEQRYETNDEWSKRIEDDFIHSKEKIYANCGTMPCGYAFPEGYYGQEGNCNSPDTTAIVVKASSPHFKTFYTQDPFGMNTGTRDPYFLNRSIPKNSWTGKDLLRHFETFDPFNYVYTQLFDFAVYDKRYHQARYWLEQMKQNGASPETVLTKEFQLCSGEGNTCKAFDLVREALSMESSPDLQNLITHWNTYGWRDWNIGYRFMNDNAGRQAWVLDNTFDLFHTGPFIWGLRERHGEYREESPSDESVVDDAGGITVNTFAGDWNSLFGEVLFHSLHKVTFSGAVKTSWTDYLQTRLAAGQSLYDTVPALKNKTINSYGDALVLFRPDDYWKAGVNYIFNSLSDDNMRNTAAVEVSRSLYASGSSSLRGMYRFLYDDMQKNSANYYSPQALVMNGLGVEWCYTDGNYCRRSRYKFFLKYLPSYAQERGVNDRITNVVEAWLEIALGERSSFRPYYRYYSTPSYLEHDYMAELTIGF